MLCASSWVPHVAVLVQLMHFLERLPFCAEGLEQAGISEWRPAWRAGSVLVPPLHATARVVQQQSKRTACVEGDHGITVFMGDHGIRIVVRVRELFTASFQRNRHTLGMRRA